MIEQTGKSIEQLVGTQFAAMMKTMNQMLRSVGDGSAIVSSTPLPKFENTMSRMHGGYVAALIDTALGCAVATKLPANTGYGTVDLNVKFVRRIDMETGELFATANALHIGRTMLTAEAKVADANGTLYAHGSGTFLVYPT